jgi:hypothetical protein
MTLIRRFTGLNLTGDANGTKGDLAVADNVRLTASGACVRRPACILRAALPAGSIGLFPKGDKPAIIADYLADLSGLSPTVHADLVRGYAGTLASFTAAVQTTDGQTAALLTTSLGVELHICPLTTPAAATVATLGFTPSAAGIAKSGGRLVISDYDGTRLRYSAVDDPTGPHSLLDWTIGTTDDDGPGFVQIGARGAGYRDPVAVVAFQDQIAVLWADAFQQWVIAPDQLGHQLVRSMVGTGCAGRATVAPAGDDMVMLGAAGTITGFRAATITLAPEAATLGAEIEDATRALYLSGVDVPAAAYWPRLGLYVIAWGNEAYVLAMVPGSRSLGWTRWTLPVECDALCSAGGELWMRSGNDLYSFDLDGNDDDGTAIPVRVETAEIDAGRAARATAYGAVTTHDTLAQVVREGRPARSGDGGIDPALGWSVVLPGRAPQWAWAVSAYAGDSFALRLQNAAAAPGFSIDAAALDIAAVKGGKGVR